MNWSSDEENPAEQVYEQEPLSKHGGLFLTEKEVETPQPITPEPPVNVKKTPEPPLNVKETPSPAKTPLQQELENVTLELSNKEFLVKDLNEEIEDKKKAINL